MRYLLIKQLQFKIESPIHLTAEPNDSWIAACCLARELPLATLKLKDFADFVEHEGLEIVPTQ